jgi:hypothetical protein
VVGKDGKLTIAVCSDRDIEYGEELTMDYCSYTHNEDEYLAAVCLCGSSICRYVADLAPPHPHGTARRLSCCCGRSSFLHFAGYDMFHRILERNYGPSRRFASLMVAGIGELHTHPF